MYPALFLFQLPVNNKIIACFFLLSNVCYKLFFIFRKRYQRKLRAASAHAYVTSFEHTHPAPGGASPGVGGEDAATRGAPFAKLDMPGTNQFAYEGSNPIYMERNHLQASQMTGM